MATGENRGVWEVRMGKMKGVTGERGNPLPNLQPFSLWAPPYPCWSAAGPLPKPPFLDPVLLPGLLSLGACLSGTTALFPPSSARPSGGGPPLLPSRAPRPRAALLGPSNCTPSSPEGPHPHRLWLLPPIPPSPVRLSRRPQLRPPLCPGPPPTASLHTAPLALSPHPGGLPSPRPPSARALVPGTSPSPNLSSFQLPISPGARGPGSVQGSAHVSKPPSFMGFSRVGDPASLSPGPESRGPDATSPTHRDPLLPATPT